MSLPTRDVCLEESSILTLISDYFEAAGHAECLLAMEHLCSGASSQHLPVELTALRHMVLAGKWDQVLQYLDRFGEVGDQEGLKRCRYLTHKQKFLETLFHVESNIQTKLRLGFSYYKNGGLLSVGETEKVHQVMEAQLNALEPLCPSPEDHQSLKTLLSVPSISSSREFSTWQVQSGRLDTLYKIQNWVSKVLCFSIAFPLQQARLSASKEVNKSCTLLRLLAKGLLYEQCEELCRARCGGEIAAKDLSVNMLDLRGWLQQQPDSSFQLPPCELCLILSPCGKDRVQSSLSVDMGAVRRESKYTLHQNTPMAKSASAFFPTQPPAELTEKVLPNRNMEQNSPESRLAKEPPSRHSTTPVTESKLVSEKRVSSARPQSAAVTQLEQMEKLATQANISTTPSVASTTSKGSSAQKPSQSQYTLPHQPSVQPIATQVEDPRVVSFDQTGDHVDGRPLSVTKTSTGKPFVPSTTPLQKTARLSSTPRDVTTSQRSLQTSPPSSPIASTPATSKVSAQQRGGGPRKHIDFNGYQQTWPTVTLLGTISDQQAIRSVAFSESGQFAAVGANSGTLRILNTTSLQSDNTSKDLDVMFEHPRCHRGSIYCLSWYKDLLVASGSNDRHVSLLSWSSSGPAPNTKAQKSPPHKGTIRDILFTPDGLLVYAGAPEIVVTDIRTYQNVVSLSGHKDQILALGVLPGGLLASGGQDKTVLLWDMRNKVPVSSLNLPEPVASLTSSGDNMVTSHLDGTCAVYDLNTFKCLSSYKPHSKECRTVRYYPKSDLKKRWVLSGSYDKTVCLTDTGNLQWTKLCQHRDKVIQCRWHPDGKMFASTGADKQACFWRIDMKSL